MAYSKTVWQDRAVSTPNTYTKSGETAGEVTLVPKPGTVTQAGTPINATIMNKIEQGIADAARMDTANTFTTPQTFSAGALFTVANRLGTALPSSYPSGISQFVVDTTFGSWPSTYGQVVTTRLNGSRTTQTFYEIASTYRTWIRHQTSGGVDTWQAWQLVWTDATLRNTNGLLEFYDGTRWVPLSGNLTYVQSNNVQYSDATQRSTTPSLNTSNFMLIAAWTPSYDGFINVSADIGVTNGAHTLTAMTPVWGSIVVNGQTSYLGLTTRGDISGLPMSRLTPLGTIVTPTTGLSNSNYNQVDLGSLNSGTSTGSVNALIAVFAGRTVFFMMKATANSGSNGPIYTKNFQIKYDKVVSD